MRRFLARVAGFTALQGVIAALVVSAYDVDPRGYFAATLDKHARLDELPPGRVAFVGGSNVAFGMDSPRVSAALDMPVVNLALHAGLGLRFLLAEAEAVAKTGDVIVLSLEYQHFRKDTTSDYLFDVLEQRPASLAFLGWRHYPMLLDSALWYFGRVVRQGFRGLIGRPVELMPVPYTRASFNDHGDVVAHRGEKRQHKGGGTMGGNPWRAGLLEPVVAQLNEFHERMQGRGVRVLYSYPPISRRAYEEVAREFGRLHRVLTETCTIPVLDTPESTWLPLGHFYDTRYHLNGKGVNERVERLLPLLREHVR